MEQRSIEWDGGFEGSRLKALLKHIRLSWHWKRIYVLHCWAGGHDEDWNSYTCMKAAGHFGSHEPTPDGDISVSFVNS